MKEESKNESEKDLQEENVNVEECSSDSNHNLAQTRAFAMKADIDSGLYGLKGTCG